MAARICSTYLGDNDGTCPVLHCIRIDGHDGDHDNAHARQLIEPLRLGIALMRSEPARFRALDAPNGWGKYDAFVPWLERYLAACEMYPDATVEVSR